MATLAEQIKQERQSRFKEEFDLETLDKYVVEQIKRCGNVHIGLLYDSAFESGYIKQKSQKNDWSSDSKWLAFADWYECYVWRTNCQIPHQFEDLVEAHLRSQGFNVTYRGACGYDKWDIMVVTL